MNLNAVQNVSENQVYTYWIIIEKYFRMNCFWGNTTEKWPFGLLYWVRVERHFPLESSLVFSFRLFRFLDVRKQGRVLKFIRLIIIMEDYRWCNLDIITNMVSNINVGLRVTLFIEAIPTQIFLKQSSVKDFRGLIGFFSNRLQLIQWPAYYTLPKNNKNLDKNFIKYFFLRR